MNAMEKYGSTYDLRQFSEEQIARFDEYLDAMYPSVELPSGAVVAMSRVMKELEPVDYYVAITDWLAEQEEATE